jgi:hypothetical protein
MFNRTLGGFLAATVALSFGSLCNEGIARATPPGTPLGGGTWSTTSSTPVEVYPASINSSDYRPNSSAQDKGGPFQTNAHLVVLFWGDYWNQSAAASTARAALTSSVATLTSGVYFSLLNQYGGIDAPTFDGAWTVGGANPTGSCQAASGGSPMDNMVQGQLSQGLIPGHGTGTPNMIYMVITPPDTAFQSPCHYNSNGVAYAWTYLHLEANSAPSVRATTLDITHEVVESITDFDPQANTAWVMVPAGADNELVDVCGAIDYLDGVDVRAYWSNAQGACAIPFPGPPTVTGVSPGSGPLTGGNTVTVAGTGFDIYGHTGVTIGGLPATPVGAPCPDGTGTSCCESTTSCTVTVPASSVAVSCAGNVATQTATIQVTANGMPSSGAVPYSYNEGAECVGIGCGSNDVYNAQGQCVSVGSACGSVGYLIDTTGQCVAVGSTCGPTPGSVMSNLGVCVPINSGCILNGDAPGVWSASGQCWAQTITCPAGEAPAGPAGQEYCASTKPVSGGHNAGGGGKGCLGKGCAAQQ